MKNRGDGKMKNVVVSSVYEYETSLIKNFYNLLPSAGNKC